MRSLYKHKVRGANCFIFVVMAVNLRQLIEWTDAKCKGGELSDFEIRHWHYDSRKIFAGENSIFLSIVTGRHNGHDFLNEAYERGVRVFLCSEERNLPDEVTILLVDDVLEALQKVASNHRNQFHYPLIGITGSNGKTIVKEWLYQLLCNQLRVVRSPRSFNSQLGLPLSLLLLTDAYELGIFEAGVSCKGEMAKLEWVLHPEIGVFTNLGDAHDEGFQSRDEKLIEKLQLFRNSKVIIYCSDNVQVHKAMQQLYKGSHLLVNWSEHHPDAAIYLEHTQLEANGRSLLVRIKGRPEILNVNIPFTDRPSLENSMIAIAVLWHLGVLTPEAVELFNRLEPIEMRLEQKEGLRNSRLLLDFYNNDITALQLAMDQLVNIYPERDKIAVLSDMSEQASKPEIYPHILEMLKQRSIASCWGIGPGWLRTTAPEGIHLKSYPNLEACLAVLEEQELEGKALLIKGSRHFEFERLAKRLEQKAHETRLEVDLSAMKHNLNEYRSRMPEQQKLMVMVKALAYGSGSHRVARMLQYEGVDYLAVAYADEGISLRQEGISLPIMVMSPTEDAFHQMLEYELEPEIYSLSLLRSFAQEIRKAGWPGAGIHLEFDTGMHRLGFVAEDIELISDILQQYPEINVRSVFSHFASSESSKRNFSELQLSHFRKIKHGLEAILPRDTLYHMANSAGILAHNDAGLFNMARLGIGLYGYDPRAEIQEALQTALKLKSYIVQLRQVKAGEGVGYGSKGAATHDRLIAVVAIGYADGYFRSFGEERGYVSIGGYRAPIVGSICMDMCMCDVTEIKGVKEKDEVEVWGDDPTIEQLAKWANTIPYEILTAVGDRVKRVYLQE